MLLLLAILPAPSVWVHDFAAAAIVVTLLHLTGAAFAVGNGWRDLVALAAAPLVYLLETAADSAAVAIGAQERRMGEDRTRGGGAETMSTQAMSTQALSTETPIAQMKTPDASVVIVSFNTRDLLARCLHTLLAELAGISAEVFVVDNASSDGSPDMVESEFPSVRLIRSEVNRGFGQPITSLCGWPPDAMPSS